MPVRKKIAVAFFFSAVIAPLALAAGEPPALDLKMPDAETGAVFHLAAAPPRVTLLVFWQVDCEPCLKDLPVLAAFAAHQPAVRLLAVSLSSRSSTRSQWQQQAMLFPSLVSNEYPEGLLTRFGDTAAAVPYAVLLDEQRRACWSLLGSLSEDVLQQALQPCGKTPAR